LMRKKVILAGGLGELLNCYWLINF
jgi:hypothetical protein